MKLLRSAPLRMVLIGTVLFAASRFWENDPWAERPHVVVPPHRLMAMRSVFLQENGRPPTPEEDTMLLDALIDQEVLYRYALELGMERQPAARQRLAQVAAFVDANPHEARSDAKLADEALALGLHEGDLVVRRILADAARRLIRAVVLTRRAQPESLREYFEANRALFVRPARVRVTHVVADGFKWADSEQRAEELLRRIRSESLSPEEAVALGGRPFVPSALPLLTHKDIQTRFGVTFERVLQSAPVGEWYGPVPSRFGHHLVWVHERRPEYVPPLDEIQARVERRFLQKLADEWLALRLQQLRAEFDVVAPQRTS